MPLTRHVSSPWPVPAVCHRDEKSSEVRIVPVKIFFCYAREDEVLLNKLKAHLRPLQRQGLIDLWHDRDISAGTEWEREIDKHLNTAQIILLLISPDFMNSEYCYSVEMRRAIERHQCGEVRVIPVIVRHVFWEGDPLGKLQALPTDAKPVVSAAWYTIDEAFFDVVGGVRKTIEEFTRISRQTPALEKSPSQSIQTDEKLQSQSSRKSAKRGSETSRQSVRYSSPPVDAGFIRYSTDRHLRKLYFRLPDGEFVSFADATAEQFVAYMKHYVNFGDTINMDEWKINGCRCQLINHVRIEGIVMDYYNRSGERVIDVNHPSEKYYQWKKEQGFS